jgi:hypothetical protein
VGSKTGHEEVSHSINQAEGAPEVSLIAS